MAKKTPIEQIRDEVRAVRVLARLALTGSQGVKGGLQAAKTREWNRGINPDAIPSEDLPTVDEELAALKMPSDAYPIPQEWPKDELEDLVRLKIHPECIAYMEGFPDETASDYFKYLGTSNLLTVEINTEWPLEKILLVLRERIRPFTSRRPGWNVSKAPLYASAWITGRGDVSDKESAKTMRRKKAAQIIKGSAPEQFGKAPVKQKAAPKDWAHFEGLKEVSKGEPGERGDIRIDLTRIFSGYIERIGKVRGETLVDWIKTNEEAEAIPYDKALRADLDGLRAALREAGYWY